MIDSAKYDRIYERWCERFAYTSGPCKSLLTGEIAMPEDEDIMPFNNRRQKTEYRVKSKSPRCSFHPDGKHNWRRNGFAGNLKQRYDCACGSHGIGE